MRDTGKTVRPKEGKESAEAVEDSVDDDAIDERGLFWAIALERDEEAEASDDVEEMEALEETLDDTGSGAAGRRGGALLFEMVMLSFSATLNWGLRSRK